MTHSQLELIAPMSLWKRLLLASRALPFGIRHIWRKFFQAQGLEPILEPGLEGPQGLSLQLADTYSHGLKDSIQSHSFGCVLFVYVTWIRRQPESSCQLMFEVWSHFPQLSLDLFVSGLHFGLQAQQLRPVLVLASLQLSIQSFLEKKEQFY